jgi:hypothetical protein
MSVELVIGKKYNMVFNQLTIGLLFILFSTTLATQLKHPFKQCSRMYILRLEMLFLFLIFLARSAGQILKASVNAPCGNDYCTFYKGDNARLEFTFTLRKLIIMENKMNFLIFS